MNHPIVSDANLHLNATAINFSQQDPVAYASNQKYHQENLLPFSHAIARQEVPKLIDVVK